MAMLRGVANQAKEDSLLKTGCFGLQVPDDDLSVEKELPGPTQGYSGKLKDDLSGQVLKDEWHEAEDEFQRAEYLYR